jgi:hypothetical protein
MTHWDLLIDKADLTRSELATAPATTSSDLKDGEVLLAVERFALTANNVTYGAMGDAFGYWRFFPAPEGMGRIPVWGFATVEASRAEGVEPGLRLFGYLPMSSHFVARLVRTRGGLVDAAEHRSELPPTYNQYVEAPADPSDDYRALLRPLFMTSWLIDDFLADQADFGAQAIILTSASSKTALGLAWALHRRGLKVVGLTSPGNTAFLEGLGLFDRVLSYADTQTLETDGPVALVDFAGNRAVIGAIHHRLGDKLVHSAVVGATHWQAPSAQGEDSLPGPKPVLFFAPDQIRKRAKEWGAEVLDTRFRAAMEAFVEDNSWLKLETAQGAEGLQTIWNKVVSGEARPEVGYIVAL